MLHMLNSDVHFHAKNGHKQVTIGGKHTEVHKSSRKEKGMPTIQSIEKRKKNRILRDLLEVAFEASKGLRLPGDAILIDSHGSLQIALHL